MAAEAPETIELDEQDQSEAFDETHVDEESAEFLTAEEAPDVFDATQALGDARDDEALDAADLEPEDLDDEDLEEDEDVDDHLDDDLEDEEDDDEIDLDDPDDENGVAELEDDEVELVDVADVDLVTDLDDEHAEEDGAKGQDQAKRKAPAGRRPEDVPDEVHPHQDELLDEGVEETFPASDPVSVKRIT